MKKRLIICGHFPRAKAAFLYHLAKIAETSGWEPFIIQQGEADLGQEYKTVQVNEWLSRINHSRCGIWTVPCAIRGSMRYPRVVLEAIGCDRNAHHAPLLQTFLGLGAVVHFLHSVVNVQRGDILLLWGSYHPFQRVVRAMAKEIGVDVFCMEYGALPGFVVCSESGINTESWPVTMKDVFNNLPLTVDDKMLAASYLSDVLATRRSMKVCDRQCGDIHQLSGGRRCLFVPGVELFASGISPRFATSSHKISPLYRNSEVLLAHIRRIASQHDWAVVYKAHPNMNSYKGYRPLLDDNAILIESGVDIYEILHACDLVVTLPSSVAQLALVAKRPCVLVGCSDLESTGSCYEVKTMADLEPTIAKAMACGLTEEQNARFLDYTSRSMKYCWFGIDEDTADYFHRGAEEMFKGMERYLNARSKVVSFDTAGIVPCDTIRTKGDLHWCANDVCR